MTIGSQFDPDGKTLEDHHREAQELRKRLRARSHQSLQVALDLKAQDLLKGGAALRLEAGRLAGLGIPDNVEPHMAISVPGGGDYSNLDLEGSETEVRLTWKWSK